MSPITKCPKCGCKNAEVKQYISGYGSYLIDLETGEIDCSSLYEALDYRNVRKYAVCLECGKKLFKIREDGSVVDE